MVFFTMQYFKIINMYYLMLISKYIKLDYNYIDTYMKASNLDGEVTFAFVEEDIQIVCSSVSK